MIVVLDANVLMRDPMCDGLAWWVLALGASSWDVAIMVPRVAVVEAVAGYRRRIGHSVEGLDKWAEKYAGQLGLRDVHDAARQECHTVAERYAKRLQAVLDSLGAMTLDPPEASLLELADRAARRQRPCDENGDGFRDTLNWLTVIGLAKRNLDQEVVWISDDKDFTDPDGKGLHEDLVAELREAGLDDRVRYYASVKELVTALVSEHPDRPLDQVREALRDRVVRKFVVDQVLPQMIDLPADPWRCGLPLGALAGRITGASVPADTEWELEVRGGVDGSAVVSFDVTATVTIVLESPVLVGDQLSSLIVKPLRVSGLVTIDDFDRPSAGELVEIAALGDDPNAAAWHALGTGMQRAFSNVVSPGWLKTADAGQASLISITPSNPTWVTVLVPHQPTIALLV